MSQFDFGVMDPYVVDGVELADFLNQFRDALFSWHRGSTRPTYIVPGMMWINDAAGPTSWVVNVYLSPTVGDVPIFTYDTTTGAVLISAASGSFAATTLLAQAAANPSVRWNATGNVIDAKAWRATAVVGGALRISAFSDAGVEQGWIQFNRDGTISQKVLGGTGLLCVINGSGWTWGSTTPINLPWDTVVINDNAGTFDTGSGFWVPPPNSSWIIDVQVVANCRTVEGDGGVSQFVLSDQDGTPQAGASIFQVNFSMSARGSGLYSFGASPAPLVWIGAIGGTSTNVDFYSDSSRMICTRVK
jgi:hypothetical protein